MYIIIIIEITPQLTHSLASLGPAGVQPGPNKQAVSRTAAAVSATEGLVPDPPMGIPMWPCDPPADPPLWWWSGDEWWAAWAWTAAAAAIWWCEWWLRAVAVKLGVAQNPEPMSEKFGQKIQNRLFFTARASFCYTWMRKLHSSHSEILKARCLRMGESGWLVNWFKSV